MEGAHLTLQTASMMLCALLRRGALTRRAVAAIGTCARRGLSTIEVEKDLASGIMTIAFNRPDRMNAWNHTTTQEYIEAFSDANRDDRIRCTVLTGRGKAFCSGADISEGFGLAGRKSKSDEVPRDSAGIAVMEVLRSLKPAIAAVNGAAVGVGASCLLSHDFIFASDTAKFGFVFSRRGVSAEGLSSLLLPRIVGPRVALDWLLTGRMVDAREAVENGFINEAVYQNGSCTKATGWTPTAAGSGSDPKLSAVSDGSQAAPISAASSKAVLDRAYEFADRLVRTTSPLSVAANRAMVWRGIAHPSTADIMHAHTVESNMLVHMIESSHAKEGMSSFFEKRPPKFDTNISETLPPFLPWWKEEEFGAILHGNKSLHEK